MKQIVKNVPSNFSFQGILQKSFHPKPPGKRFWFTHVLWIMVIASIQEICIVLGMEPWPSFRAMLARQRLSRRF